MSYDDRKLTAGRVVASAVALSLMVAAAGPEAARAMAAAVSAPVQAVPAVGVPFGAAAVLAQGSAAAAPLQDLTLTPGKGLALPAPSMPGLQPASPSVVRAQALAPASAIPAAGLAAGPMAPAARARGAAPVTAALKPGSGAPAAAAARGVGPVERASGLVAALPGCAPQAPAGAPLRAPESGSTRAADKMIGRLTKTLLPSSPADGETAGRLGRFFDNSRPSGAEEAPALRTAAPSQLRPALAAAQGQETAGRAVPSLGKASEEPPAPRSSWTRSAKFGVALAAIGLLTNVVVPVVAMAMGYHMHPNYNGPSAVKVKTLTDLFRMAVASTVIAPVTEEVVFRGVLMGGLAVAGAKAAAWFGGHPKLTEALAHWLPALISSVIFVALHETADPVAFFVRMVTSMLLSEAFHREGLLASIPLHFVNNFVALAGLVAQVLFGPAGVPLAFAAMMGALALAHKFWGELQAQEPDVKAGRIVPQKLTPAWALGLAALSLAGVAFFAFSYKGLVLWSAAAALYVAYAAAYGLMHRPPFDYPAKPAA